MKENYKAYGFPKDKGSKDGTSQAILNYYIRVTKSSFLEYSYCKL